MNDAQHPTTEDVSTRLGARVKEVRQDRGLTRSDLSVRSGVGRTTLADLEHAARVPTLETVAKVAEALGVSVPALLGGPSTAPDTLYTRTAVLRDHAEVDTLGVWETPDDRIEVFRVRLSSASVRVPPGRAGGRGYLTCLAGTLTAGAAATPRTLGPGGQLAYAIDQPHIYQAGGPAEATLVMRYPREVRGS